MSPEQSVPAYLPNVIPVNYSCWHEYALLDVGNYQKLERFGKQLLVRSEPKAWGLPSFATEEWTKADAVCNADGRWHFGKDVRREWVLTYKNLNFQVRCTDMSKHIGIFPEQVSHWTWITSQLEQTSLDLSKKRGIHKPCRVLSLFGYTGAASLVAAANGAVVTHIDASKPAISWAKINQQLSGLSSFPIRFMVDDAHKFIKREFRRGAHYDALILDPPSFGRGPKGEVWKAEKNLIPLLENCRQILSESPRFVLLTMYALEASALMMGNLLAAMMAGIDGSIEIGELALQPENGSNPLPMAIFARWVSST